MLSEDFPALLVGVRAGSVVAGYRLEEQVGTGGMAVVFRARDERLGRRVALKILAPPLAADPAFRRRFIAESRAAAADDPHVIPIYEAGVTGFALSPGGTRLAVAVQPNNVKADPELTELKLYSTATGAVLRTWDADGTIGLNLDNPEALSWTSDQRTLAFVWLGGPGSGQPPGEWLLDLGRSGTSLIGDSREAMSTGSSTAPLPCEEDLILTPDGSAAVCGATNSRRRRPRRRSTSSRRRTESWRGPSRAGP